jgi:UDP-N-acetyl-D-glucosamine dehydrogenase
MVENGLTGIIGLGYVGLPLLIDFCEAGLKVIGFDIDEEKIYVLENGQSYISYIPAEQIAKFVNDGRFIPTSDFSRLKEVDNIIIAVPTPLNINREPDLTFVENTTRTIAENLRDGQLIVLESTTYPGTTREVLLPILKEKGGKAGKDFFLAYSPERVDPNNKNYRAREIPKVIGGITPACLERAVQLYSRVFRKLVPVTSTEVAEASKLLENIFRSVNIALVNEMKLLFDRMGIDIWEVIEASTSKPFGFMPFYPGPGLGGHCIPIDPFYLTWKARQYDFMTRFIELAGEINTSMPYYVLQKTIDALNENGKSIKGARVLVLGAAYKKDVDDIRESPAVKIITLLKEKGAQVIYHDPYIPEIKGMRKYPGLIMKAVELEEETLQGVDCVLLVTDHSCYDYGWILDNSTLIVDTRNAFKDYRSPKIYKAYLPARAGAVRACQQVQKEIVADFGT